MLRTISRCAALVLVASQIGACWCTACLGSASPFQPTPSLGNDLPRVLALPQATGGAGWAAGPELSAVTNDGHTEIGLGGQAVCEITGQPLGLTTGASLYFPDQGSAYGAWAGYQYNVESEGSVDLFGVGAALWSHAGYGSDYEIPDGEFSGLGGGAGAFQQGFGGSGDAFGMRLGVGAVLDREDSRVTPYGEVGYDVFLLGEDFGNQLRFAAGLRLHLGG